MFVVACTGTYLATARYSIHEVGGMRIVVAPELADERVNIAVIEGKVAELRARVPQRVLDRLSGLAIWIEGGPTDRALAGYHGRDWVSRHGLNPEKADAVEIADVHMFLRKLRTSPLAMFHELAHALLARSPELVGPARRAYARAVQNGRYRASVRGV